MSATTPPRGITLLNPASPLYARLRTAMGANSPEFDNATLVRYDQRFHVMRWVMMLLALAVFIIFLVFALSFDMPRVTLGLALVSFVCAFGYRVMSSSTHLLLFGNGVLAIMSPGIPGIRQRRIVFSRDEVEDSILERATTPHGPNYTLTLRLADGKKFPLIRRERLRRKAEWLDNFLSVWLG